MKEEIEPLKDVGALCQFLFGVAPYPYQEKILNWVMHPGDRKSNKLTIRATTRAGKSYAVALAAVLFAIFRDGIRIGIIAPTLEKTDPIMNYIAEFLSSNSIFDQIVMVDTAGLTKLERLRKEVSKRRITFRNGSSIEIKTVDIAKKGFGVMGFAYDFTIVDESGMLPDIVWGKIFRMLLESPDALLLEIGNPWFLNHFYEHHNSADWEKMRISWKDCVEAGRLTTDAVEEQRRDQTELEFKVLLDADFPEEVEYAIFPKEAVEKMTSLKMPEKFERILIGVDVARGGTDRTVITRFGTIGREFYFLDHREPPLVSARDTMVIAGLVMRAIEISDTKGYEVSVDTVGVGAGVYDRLKELNANVYEFQAGRNARNTKRFANIKTEAVFKTADLAKDGRIFNVPTSSRLILELRSWIYEVRSDKQVKVVDPEKSPDYADSMVIALNRHTYDDEDIRVVGFERRLSETRRGIIKGHEKFKKRYV